MKYLKIKKNTHFQRLFKRGKRVFSPCLTLLYVPSDKLRMGIAVSKKHGKAVARNRIKRLVRQAFFNCNQILKIPCDVVVLPKVAPVGVEYSLKDYEKSLITCLNKINSCEKIK